MSVCVVESYDHWTLLLCLPWKEKAETRGGKELWRKDFVKLANKEDKKSSGDKIAQIYALQRLIVITWQLKSDYHDDEISRWLQPDDRDNLMGTKLRVCRGAAAMGGETPLASHTLILIHCDCRIFILHWIRSFVISRAPCAGLGLVLFFWCNCRHIWITVLNM